MRKLVGILTSCPDPYLLRKHQLTLNKAAVHDTCLSGFIRVMNALYGTARDGYNVRCLFRESSRNTFAQQRGNIKTGFRCDVIRPIRQKSLAHGKQTRKRRRQVVILAGNGDSPRENLAAVSF